MTEEGSSRSIMDKLYWPIVIILIILLIWAFFPNNNIQPDDVGTFASSPSQFGGTALTDSCVEHEDVGMHYHFTLFLFINDTEMTLPSNIGVESGCMRPIHTHDPTGEVHIELSEDYSGNTPTLHDFFSIWGYDFNRNKLLNQTGEVSLEINSEAIHIDDNLPEGYRMADGDTIIIKLNK